MIDEVRFQALYDVRHRIYLLRLILTFLLHKNPTPTFSSWAQDIGNDNFIFQSELPTFPKLEEKVLSLKVTVVHCHQKRRKKML